VISKSLYLNKRNRREKRTRILAISDIFSEIPMPMFYENLVEIDVE